jgi:hypothetical protein
MKKQTDEWHKHPHTRTTNSCGGGLEYLHSSPASRKRRHETEPNAREHNWATLLLGDINTGTWPSRLGESQTREQDMVTSSAGLGPESDSELYE